MKPRDLFGVSLRILGIWFFSQAGYWGFWALWKNAGGPGNPNVPVGVDVASCLLYAAMGAILLFFADFIVLGIYGPIAKAMPDTVVNPE